GKHEIVGIPPDVFADRVDLVQRLLDSHGPHGSTINPNGEENGVHPAFAHAGDVDASVRIPLAQVKILGEEALRGVVVRIQHDGGKVQLVSPLGDVVRPRLARGQQNENRGQTDQQNSNHSAHGFSSGK